MELDNLSKLTQELCPDGVEFVKLGEVCNLSRGKVYSKKYLAEHLGCYPVYSSQTANDGKLGDIDTYDYDGTYLTWTTDGAYAGTVFYREGKFSITNVCGLISIKSNRVIIKFLYYWLSVVASRYVHKGMGNPKLMSNQMASVVIPLPPIEVQTEIVRILDQVSRVSAELEAELELRKKQYKYISKKVLTFGDDVEWKKLGEVCEVKTGRLNANASVENGKYPFFTCSEKPTKIDTYAFDCEALLVSGNGNVGYVNYYNGKFNAYQRTYVLFNFKENIKYLKFYFDYCLKKYLSTKLNKGSVPYIKLNDLLNFKIPIPSLEKQQEIVSILDPLDRCINSITKGLPAEIKLRKLQYKVIRDKLLTFKRK